MSFMGHGWRARHALYEIEEAHDSNLEAAYKAGFDSGLESALIVVRASHACTGRHPEIGEWIAREIPRIESLKGSALRH